MALPLVVGTMVGGLIAGLTQFFASKAATILLGLGLTFVAAKGLTTLVGYVIGDMQTVVAALGGAGGTLGGVAVGGAVVQLLGVAGFFEGLNILASGYMTYFGFVMMKVALARMQS